MNRRVQIVISSKPQGIPVAGQPLGYWQRVKSTLAALASATFALGVLITLVIFGSLIFAVLWTLLVLAVTGAILRLEFRKAKAKMGV